MGILCTFIIAMFVILVLLGNSLMKELIVLSNTIDILNKKIKEKNLEIESQLKTIEKLKNLSNENINTPSEYSEEIKNAVKYAMVKAHPDNKGNAEDFYKFRKLYENIK